MGVIIPTYSQEEVEFIGMSLGQLCQIIPPKQDMRICTDEGTGFIFIGKRKSLRIQTLNRQLLDWHVERVAGRLWRMKGGGRSKEGNWAICEEAISDLRNLRALASRPVLNVEQGLLEPDSIVIQIPGIEGWEHYDPPMTTQKLNAAAAERLAYGFHKTACLDLVHAYETVAVSKNKLKVLEAEETIREQEAWIKSNVYGFLSDPQTIIAACKRAAEENISERQK